ncbi:MAG TPA: sugar phosphate nucleotidyltransferase [Longimicrobiales bacterium]|nr:sugar phosphate nucleotidyltransferase [Longimicrobiales bacterium]
MHSSQTDPPLWAVVLAGGTGSRFWPVSTPARPKQLLPLAGEEPLISQTIDRINPLVSPERIRVLTGRHLADPILQAVPGLTRAQLMVEPMARGTAPALVWAAHAIAREEPDAVMASLHADHVITPNEAFRELLADVARLAAAHRLLFTIGIEPTRPETGYGYIHVGPPIGPRVEAWRVADFVEKPDRDTAQEYLRRGGYLWNSGIFVWRVRDLLDQIQAHTPELARLMPLLDAGDVVGFFEQAPDLSIDEGLLERSPDVGVARATFAWDDVGAWDAVGRTRQPDADGNVAIGDVHLVDSKDCVAWSEDGSIVVFGGEGLVVVRAHGITVVAARERTPDLKELLRQLPERLREPGK